MSELKKTPIHPLHKKKGAKLVEFGGYEMPIVYTSIVEEHHQVRNHIGLFDLCHMGRIHVSGEGALAFLQKVITNSIKKLKPGGAKYSLITNEKGTVLDDIIVYRRPKNYMVVCNAANRDKIWQWFNHHVKNEKNVILSDDSDTLGMIAIQGKESAPLVKALVEDIDIDNMKYYNCGEGTIVGHPGMVARTGYTGEDGFELYLANDHLKLLWNKALAEEGHNIRPIGLGARDTLRLEAAMPLYGQELTEKINPLEAGLKFAVKLKKDFIGRDALRKIKEEGVKKKLVCMEVKSKRIARPHATLYRQGEEVGEVTSGTSSPTLGKSIAMGYLPVEMAEVGTTVEVKIGRKMYPVEVIPRPFYKRED